jgi:uncharacterized protein YaaR (DUF327 family)
MSEAKRKQKNAMFSGRLQKSGDKLIYTSTVQDKQYKEFVKSLEEGQIVEIFMDANKDTGTLAQIAKIYKCIREIASETGDGVEEVKIRVKRKAGLCFKVDVEGELYMVCKSFGDCSVEDLGLAIQTIIEMGDYLNMNLR